MAKGANETKQDHVKLFNKHAREYNQMRLRVRLIADKTKPYYFTLLKRLQMKKVHLEAIKAVIDGQ